MSVVIKAENISKKYIISHQDNKGRYRYSTLRESMYSLFSKKNKYTKEEFWALKDINFEVNQGDKLGIIGRNGAGKSTLLKILSRITEPTTGKIGIKGKIASLLEVGTGFHPELTGRENIFLNGSILGMTYKEIKKKFEEIVDFAGIENFLDTPVKRYSSGMYVRLAFSVAAHLNTDILLVDEVLAVGDAEFQKKCLGKMDDISKSEGKTILFVSHNLPMLEKLCKLSIIIDNGSLLIKEKTDKATYIYLQKILPSFSYNGLEKVKDRKGNGLVKFSEFKLKNKNKDYINFLKTGQFVIFEVTIINNTNSIIKNLLISVGVDLNEQRLFLLSNKLTGEYFDNIKPGKNIINIEIENLPLKKGKYTYTLFSSLNDDITDWIINAGEFIVEDGIFFKKGKNIGNEESLFYLEHKFYLNND